VLSRAQAQRLLEASAGTRQEALYTLALATGMRQGELLGLRWRDVDLDAGVLRVRASLRRSRKTGDWHFAEPKTRRSRRQLALGPETIEVLRRQRARQAQSRLLVGAAWRDLDLVFATEAGGPLLARNVYRSFMQLLARAELPRVRFHDLRHTAATLLLSARVNPKVVSELLGHASVAITLDIYSHVLPDMQQDAAATMDRLLRRS
jgi:integrase